MALQIRRGLESQRGAVTPEAGELLYTTDEKLVYVGDGTTAGGNLLAGGGSGSLNNIVEDTTPQLGGDLDINGYKIVSTGDGNIEIDPGGTGNVILHGALTIDQYGNFTKTGLLNISPTLGAVFGRNDTLVDGNIYITRNTYSTLAGFTFAQHHNTADAVNFAFHRSRGTGDVQTAVVNGDDLIDISFTGYDGTNRVSGAAISATVEGVPTTGQIPTKMSFVTNNGTATAIRAELSAAGVWKVNSIQNYSGSTLSLTATTVSVSGNVQLNAQNDLRFADADSSNYVAFQAPTTVVSNVTWTLPSADGTVGQVLTTNGGGTLSWSTTSAGSGLTSRIGLAPVTTGSLASGASEDLIITGYKGYVLYKIETDSAAWVRLYSSTAARTADASRLEGTDPLPGSGVIAEIISTGAETILITPGALGFSTESVPNTQIPCTITNKSGVTTTITVTLTVLQIEV
jgi:hypothetical protein